MSFIINRWVRGKDFFGRGHLLAQILERGNKPTWVLGNRRVGKTSLLRQIHHLCKTGAWPNRLALYWDLQGAGTSEGLKESLLECFEDNEDVAAELGVDIDELEDCTLKDMLNKVRRKAKGLDGKHLYLLIDECEELVDITRSEPGVLASFRKLGNGEVPLSLIMAGSWRLMDLDESDSITSPFLPDFLPPLLLGPFQADDSRELLAACGLTPSMADTLHRLSLGNPHLLQVLGEHCQRNGSLELALAELKLNKVAHYFFQSNFNCLPPQIRPFFSAGTACVNLLALEAQDPLAPFVVQSCLISFEEGKRLAPLLTMVERDLGPLEVLSLLDQSTEPIKLAPPLSALTAPAPLTPGASAAGPATPAVAAPPVAAAVAASPAAAERELGALAALLARQDEFRGSLLPRPGGSSGDWSEISQLTGTESSEVLNELLDRASPEFLRGEFPSERTAIYLFGLSWYRALAGKGPFAELSPWDRLAALSERDVPIDEAFLRTTKLPSKQAIVLLRCLKAEPGQRYASLTAVRADLAEWL